MTTSTAQTETETPKLERRIDDTRTGLIFVVGLVSVILVFVIVTCTQAWFYTREEAANAAATYGKHPLELQDYLNEEHKKIDDTWQWVDEKKTAAHIPLDKAMEIYLSKHLKSGNP